MAARGSRAKKPRGANVTAPRALREYRRKRDFEVTPEPRGATVAGKRRSFVIQKHAASRLHYDFRLEMEGVLRSWSIPKGPSLDPRDKRLAVQTEDHPVEYADFEGVIPEGEYGGGAVAIWDRGQWEPVGDAEEDYRKGALKFLLHGSKLRGRFVLARIGGHKSGERSWLLIKQRDEWARAGEPKIVDERPESVVSGRTVDEIAADRDHVWHSNRPPIDETRRRSARRLAPLPAAAHEPAGAESELLRPETLPGARRQSTPRFVPPELATLVDSAPDGLEWLHELKYDGYRIVSLLAGGRVQLWSRSGKDWTARLRPVAASLEQLEVGQALFDGEVAVVLPDGTTRFQVLQNVLSQRDRGQLVYFVFDLLHLDGYDLRAAPLVRRKDLLQRLLAHGAGEAEAPVVRYSAHIEGHGPEFFRSACQRGLEGIVCKRLSADYQSGRSRDWLKVKCLLEQEVVIGGMTPPKGSRVGLGALLVGVHDDAGRLRYAGKVGTGFTDASLRELRERLGQRVQRTSPFVDRVPSAARATWTRPDLVAEVAFTEWTNDGRMRHPSFHGLREDKLAREVVRERPLRVAETAAGECPPSHGTDPARRTHHT
jgi:bifunctional non-homologous end joining protein LigD